jgi:hypothetical protein
MMPPLALGEAAEPAMNHGGKQRPLSVDLPSAAIHPMDAESMTPSSISHLRDEEIEGRRQRTEIHNSSCMEESSSSLLTKPPNSSLHRSSFNHNSSSRRKKLYTQRYA